MKIKTIFDELIGRISVSETYKKEFENNNFGKGIIKGMECEEMKRVNNKRI